MGSSRPTIINVSSVAGLTSTGSGAIYGMTKAAVVQLTKTLACEWAHQGARALRLRLRPLRRGLTHPWLDRYPSEQRRAVGDPHAAAGRGTAHQPAVPGQGVCVDAAAEAS